MPAKAHALSCFLKIRQKELVFHSFIAKKDYSTKFVAIVKHVVLDWSKPAFEKEYLSILGKKLNDKGFKDESFTKI